MVQQRTFGKLSEDRTLFGHRIRYGYSAPEPSAPDPASAAAQRRAQGRDWYFNRFRQTGEMPDDPGVARYVRMYHNRDRVTGFDTARPGGIMGGQAPDFLGADTRDALKAINAGAKMREAAAYGVDDTPVSRFFPGQGKWGGGSDVTAMPPPPLMGPEADRAVRRLANRGEVAIVGPGAVKAGQPKVTPARIYEIAERPWTAEDPRFPKGHGDLPWAIRYENDRGEVEHSIMQGHHRVAAAYVHNRLSNTPQMFTPAFVWDSGSQELADRSVEYIHKSQERGEILQRRQLGRMEADSAVPQAVKNLMRAVYGGGQEREHSIDHQRIDDAMGPSTAAAVMRRANRGSSLVPGVSPTDVREARGVLDQVGRGMGTGTAERALKFGGTTYGMGTDKMIAKRKLARRWGMDITDARTNEVVEYNREAKAAGWWRQDTEHPRRA